MPTITEVTNDQSIGTSTNVGNGKFEQKLTLGAETHQLQIEASIVLGAGFYDQRAEVIMHFVVSALDMTAAAAKAVLWNHAKQLAVKYASASGGASAAMTNPIQAPGGGFLYLWYDIPPTTVASTLSANVIEYPGEAAAV